MSCVRYTDPLYCVSVKQRFALLHLAPTRLLLRGFVVALSVVLLAASIWWDNAANRGITPPRSQPLPWTDVPRGGVNTYSLHLEVVTPEQRRSGDNKVARTMQMIAAAGFHYVRVQFPWEDIEVCGKGQFLDCRHGDVHQSTWIKYDYIVEQARANNLELIVRLDRPPDWARAGMIASPEVQAALKEGRPVTGPPDNYGDFADFAGAVARHFKGRIRFYQIWNEPNLPGEWNYQDQNPVDFVRLLRAANVSIKAANPDAVILFPALSPTDGADSTATNDLDYLQGIYDAGGRDAFDIMSAQFYGLGQPPDEHRYITPGNHSWLRPIETRTDVGRVVLQHEIMVRNGDTNKAVWISELGWNSAPQGFEQPWGVSVSEEEKARYLVGAMERAQREWPWMGPMCIWMFRWGGEPPAPADPTPYFALVDFNFKPFPAYNAVSTYLHALPVLPRVHPNPVAMLATGMTSLLAIAAMMWFWPVFMAMAGGVFFGAVRVARRLGRTGVRPMRRVSPSVSRIWHDDRIALAIMLVGLAIFYRASAQLPITLVGALIFIPMALLRPDLALFLVPLTVPLYLAPKGVWDKRFGLSRPEGYFVPLHEVVLLVSVGGTLLRALPWWGWLSRLRRMREYVLPLLFLLVGTLGVFVATERGTALREWRWLIVEPLMFYALVRWYGRSSVWRKRLVWAWFIAGGLVGLIAVLQLAGLNLAVIISRQTCFSQSVVVTEGVRRATSVYCHPNNLGLALGRLWPVPAALLLGLGDGLGLSATLRALWKRRSERYVQGLLCVLFLSLAGIAASVSKGAFIGGFVAVVALGLLLRHRWILWFAAAGVVVILIGAQIFGIERLNPVGGSSGARIELWQSAVAMLKDHPLTGIGLDQFLALRTHDTTGRYITPDARMTSEQYAAHPHNLLLDILLRVGPLGMLVFVALIWQFFRRSLRIARHDQGEHRLLVIGLAVSMIAALVHGMVDNFYFVPDLAMVFWMQLALVRLIDRETHEPL